MGLKKGVTGLKKGVMGLKGGRLDPKRGCVEGERGLRAPRGSWRNGGKAAAGAGGG